MNFSLVAILLSAYLPGLFLACKEVKSSPDKDCDLPVLRVMVNGNVSVRCPNTWHKGTTFRLLKNGDLISSFKGNQTEPLNQTESNTELLVDRHNHTHFVLSQVMVNSTGLYTCEAELSGPSQKFLKKKTVIFVEESECPQQEAPLCPPISYKAWLWAACCGVILIYNMVITIISLRFWHKLRSWHCLQNDYINMKPVGFKRYQGVQHPVRTGKY